jgi:hypothetical protein
MKKAAPRTARAASRLRARFRITHPFHPLYPGEYDILEFRRDWGHELVAFHDEQGKVVTIPIRWTDLAIECDPFIAMSAGRSHFRVQELLRLAELVAGLRSRETGR